MRYVKHGVSQTNRMALWRVRRHSPWAHNNKFWQWHHRTKYGKVQTSSMPLAAITQNIKGSSPEEFRQTRDIMRCRLPMFSWKTKTVLTNKLRLNRPLDWIVPATEIQKPGRDLPRTTYRLFPAKMNTNATPLGACGEIKTIEEHLNTSWWRLQNQ